MGFECGLYKVINDSILIESTFLGCRMNHTLDKFIVNFSQSKPAQCMLGSDNSDNDDYEYFLEYDDVIKLVGELKSIGEELNKFSYRQLYGYSDETLSKAEYNYIDSKLVLLKDRMYDLNISEDTNLGQLKAVYDAFNAQIITEELKENKNVKLLYYRSY